MRKIVLITLIALILPLISPLKAQNLKGNWQFIGPTKAFEQVMGLVWSVWVDTTNLNFVLAGTAAGGLWQCDNAQSALPKWKNISDSYDSVCTGVYGIAVKPGTNHKTIYIATKTSTKDLIKPFGIGILKSDNGGASWTRVGPQKNIVIDRLKMCPDDPSVMIASSGKDLFITTDDWKTFKTITVPTKNVDPDYQVADIEFAPFSNKIIYIGTRSVKNDMADLFMSKDQGENFEDIKHGLKGERFDISVIRNKKFSDKFYIAYGYSEANVQFFNGKTWSDNLNKEPVKHTFGGPYWTFGFEVNQVDTNVMYIAMTEVSKSVDGGKTFQNVAYYNTHNTHADVRDINLAHSTLGGKKDILFLGNDGGISQSNEGVTAYDKWNSINGTGMGITQFWGLDVWQSDTLFIAGGTQDNGFFWYKDSVWQNNLFYCGDGYDAAVITKNTFVVECNVPTILQNNTKTKGVWQLALPDNYCKGGVRPIKYLNGKMYLGHRQLYEFDALKIEDNDYKVKNKTNFDEVKDTEGGILNNAVNAFDICAGDYNVACVAFTGPIWDKGPLKGKLFFSRDFYAKEPTWEDITPFAKGPDGFEICRWTEVCNIVIDDMDPDIIYLITKEVFDQTSCRVYFMEYKPNSGTWEVSDKTFNLPKAGINKIVKEKDADNIYLATDQGLYYTNLSLLSNSRWEKFNGNTNKIPECLVTDIVINYENNKIYCSTYARGIWEGELASSLNFHFNYAKSTKVEIPQRVDGRLVISANASVEFNSKLFIAKGSVIELKKGAKLIVKKGNSYTYDGKRTDLKPFLKQAAGSEVIYK